MYTRAPIPYLPSTRFRTPHVIRHPFFCMFAPPQRTPTIIRYPDPIPPRRSPPQSSPTLLSHPSSVLLLTTYQSHPPSSRSPLPSSHLSPLSSIPRSQSLQLSPSFLPIPSRSPIALFDLPPSIRSLCRSLRPLILIKQCIVTSPLLFPPSPFSSNYTLLTPLLFSPLPPSPPPYQAQPSQVISPRLIGFQLIVSTHPHLTSFLFPLFFLLLLVLCLPYPISTLFPSLLSSPSSPVTHSPYSSLPTIPPNPSNPHTKIQCPMSQPRPKTHSRPRVRKLACVAQESLFAREKDGKMVRREDAWEERWRAIEGIRG